MKSLRNKEGWEGKILSEMIRVTKSLLPLQCVTNMTHIIHITTAPSTEPAAIGAEAREKADRELSAARAELASLGAAVSPSRLERALERLEAAQRASRRPIPRAA